MAGGPILFAIVLFAVNLFILKWAVSWRVEKIDWKDTFILAIILTGAGMIASMFLSPLALI